MKNHYATILLAVLTALGAQAQYCSPTFVNGCFSWANQTITIGTIDWSLGATDCLVSDYTSLSTDVGPGVATPMSVTSGVWTGCAVWVDLDNSQSFEDSENLHYVYVGGDPSHTYDFDITVPVGTSPGPHRMRVIGPWGSDGFLTTNTNGYGPCGSYQYGNFEDFMLNVVTELGVSESAHSGNTVTVAPNPTQSFLTITTDGRAPVRRITLFAADGRQVMDLPITAPAPQQRIDLTAFPSGLYQLKCWNGATTSTTRVVKE